MCLACPSVAPSACAHASDFLRTCPMPVLLARLGNAHFSRIALNSTTSQPFAIHGCSGSVDCLDRLPADLFTHNPLAPMRSAGQILFVASSGGDNLVGGRIRTAVEELNSCFQSGASHVDTCLRHCGVVFGTLRFTHLEDTEAEFAKQISCTRTDEIRPSASCGDRKGLLYGKHAALDFDAPCTKWFWLLRPEFI